MKMIREGDTFGYWKALQNRMSGMVKMPCVCQCGERREVFINNLLSGGSTSCGCKEYKLSGNMSQWWLRNSIPAKDNATGYPGVRETETGKFAARLRYKGKSYHLGTFLTAKEAGAAYDARKQELLKGETE